MKTFIKTYFDKKGLIYKEAGDNQYALEKCEACGDAKFHHFYMGQETGLWDCKKCGAKGNFNQFRNFFGDNAVDLTQFEGKSGEVKKPKEYRVPKFDLALQYASRLWASDKHYEDYLLTTRQLKKEVIQEFKIGSSGEGISIPIYEDDKLVNIRYRRDPRVDGDANAAPRYAQETGCKPALFNGDILKGDIKQVYITEGEFDALQLIQRGLKNTVSVTLGAGYFPEDWVEKFENVKQIYFVFDTDEEGIQGAKKAAKKLGMERCKIVSLPKVNNRKKTDITNFFVDEKKTKQDFMDLVSKAKLVRSTDDDIIKHVSDFNDELRKLLLEGEHLGELTGFGKLDEAIGGLRKGRLIVIAGLTNTGKSSFALNMCMNMGARKMPSFYFSLEMPPIDIAKKLLMLRSKLTGTDLKEIPDPSDTLVKIDDTLSEFKGVGDDDGFPIYLYNGSGVVAFKILEECARIAKEEYNCQCVFVDHLHYFAMGSNVTTETSQVVRQIKQLAMKLDLPIVLLAHLNRGGRTNKRTGLYIPTLADLKDTSTIEQDADQVLFVCRDSESEDDDVKQKAVIKVAKNRDGKSGIAVSMKFNDENTVFSEVAKDVDYAGEAKELKAELEAPLKEPDTTLPF